MSLVRFLFQPPSCAHTFRQKSCLSRVRLRMRSCLIYRRAGTHICAMVAYRPIDLLSSVTCSKQCCTFNLCWAEYCAQHTSWCTVFQMFASAPESCSMGSRPSSTFRNSVASAIDLFVLALVCDPYLLSGACRWIISWRYFTSVFIKPTMGFRRFLPYSYCRRA